MNRFCTGILGLIGIILLFTGGCSEPMKESTLCNGTCTALLPAMPQEKEIQIVFSDKAKGLQFETAVELKGKGSMLLQKDKGFLITCFDIPEKITTCETPDRITDVVFRTVLQDTMHCNPLKQAEGLLGGCKAMEFTFEGPGVFVSLSGRGIARSCFSKNRVYIALCMVPLSAFDDKKPMIEKFLNSFTIK